MCDRCFGITFLGLAEPQKALLESFTAAIRCGWLPTGAQQTETELLKSIASDADAFLARLADTTISDEAGTVRSAKLVRWLWDSSFRGEIALTYDGTSKGAPILEIACNLVPGLPDDYDARARRQFAEEARALGIPVSEGPVSEAPVPERP